MYRCTTKVAMNDDDCFFIQEQEGRRRTPRAVPEIYWSFRVASPVSRRADKGVEVIDWDQLPLWVRHGSWCQDPPPMPWIGVVPNGDEAKEL